MPSAGDLRERVSLQEPTPSDDGFGNVVEGWTPRAMRRAMYVMRPGSEAVNAARLEGRQPVTVIVKFDAVTSAVTPAWRIVDQRTGRTYAVRAAEDMDRRRQWMSFVCEAEVT